MTLFDLEILPPIVGSLTSNYIIIICTDLIVATVGTFHQEIEQLL